MAQLARTNPTEWEEMRKSIVRFGKDSKLFSDIEVRSLGRNDSDPFQVNVVINGPKRNIMDVGYGVSQAIPIVYELLRRYPRSLYIAQQPEVHLHPEAQAALGSLIAEESKRINGYIVIETHSDFLIDRIRRHVRDGILSPRDLSLLYFSRNELSADIKKIEIDNQGNVIDTPDGYRDFFLREELTNLGFE
jgi:predicted ATPase